MTSRFIVPAEPVALPVRKRLTQIVFALLMVVALPSAFLGALPGVGPAWAGDQPIGEDEIAGMRERLVTGEENERKGVLRELHGFPDATQPALYGQILGPIFREPDETKGLDPAGRRELFAILIVHLADEQSEKTNEVLLGEAFLPLMVADPLLIERLKAPKGLVEDYKTKEKKGWSRILARARALLGDETPEVRRAAIRISALCECADVADAIASLYEVLKIAPRPLASADADAYLVAAESLLEHRFSDVPALLSFLDPFSARFEVRKDLKRWTQARAYRLRGDLLEAVIRLLNDRGGAQMTRARQAALDYGVELIRKADKPEDLLGFFDPAKERIVELQRAALAAARTLKPANGSPAPDKPTALEAWAALLTSALQHSTDGEVLAATIDILSPMFTKPGEVTRALAGAVAARLQQRAQTDAPKLRESLARILGLIGSRGDVVKALKLVSASDMLEAGPSEIPVYGALIRDLGRVSGGFVGTLAPYYVTTEPLKSPVWERLAVAKALGYGGIRGDALQSKLAGLFLRHILTGAAITGADNIEAGVAAEPVKDHLLRTATDPESNPDVRAAGIESLRWYPSAATAGVLTQIAGESSPAAKRALTILGRQLKAGSDDAAVALARLVDEDVSAQLAGAVFDAILATKPPAVVSAEDALAAAARLVLDRPDTSAELLIKAARVSGHLADAKSLKRLRMIWTGHATDSPERKAWGDLIRAVFVAAAERGRDDAVLSDQLHEIADGGLRDEVLSFFETMGKAADRPTLKRAHAAIHTTRGTDDQRTKAEQREDLDEAITLYTQLIKDATTPAARVDMHGLLHRTLLLRASEERLGEGEKAAEFRLRAFRTARDSGDKSLADRSLESLAEILKQSPDLNEAQRKEVEQLTKELQALPASPQK